MTTYRLAALALALAAAGTGASAQNAPLPPPRPGAALDAQKAAFLAVPEIDRKAIQDALGWLGLYNGVVDGGFGKRTLDAITAYQGSVGAPTDGVVTPPQLAALKLAAQRARAAVGFQIFDDPATGIRIGAPLKLLEKKTAGVGQTRFSARDGAVSLELTAPPAGHENLAEIYKGMIADTAGRKVTYKAIKPDAFFVVAGEEAGHKFYMRYAQAPANASDAGAPRGFVFTYPTARAATMDALSLAVANAFDPFPTTPLGKPVAINPTPSSLPAPTPAGPALTATALVVAPGQALTALREADCREPTILGKPVKFVKADASGIALLGGDFGAGPPAPPRGAGSANLIVLSLIPAPAGKVVLEASDADAQAVDTQRRSVVAALGLGARGAPVFDRQGGFAGMIAPLAGAPKKFGGVTLAEPHPLIESAALAVFAGLGESAPAGEPLGVADIARRMRGAIVGVFCVP
jgi:hypothetical protein